MRIIYEINPPRITGKDLFFLEQNMTIMANRAEKLTNLVDGILLTDSVLGIPRLSSVAAASYLGSKLFGTDRHPVSLGCSVRTRDRNYLGVCQLASEALCSKIDNLLFLKGDESIDGRSSTLTPTATITMLRKDGFDGKIKMNLSIPSRIRSQDKHHLQRKIDTVPYAFVTQSISSLADLGELADLVKPHGIRLTACIMIPSAKNIESARAIALDWKEYEKRPVEFVLDATKLADEILLTSPNSFSDGVSFLSRLQM